MKHIRRSRHRRSVSHDSLPYGVRMLALMRAVRWIGWGLGEALLPVFILSFSKTFAEAGLFSSTVDITSLLSLPLIGLWADRVSAKRLILISLLLYPLVGLSYFFAGAIGMALFVVIARVINGFTWELENIGIETYYRRSVDGSHIASSFGYVDTWSHVAWIGAALVGMFLVAFVPVHVLLLGIAPFVLVSYFIARKAPLDSPRGPREDKKVSLLGSYGKAVSEWRAWNGHLQLLGVLVFFSSIVSCFMYFFVPIDAYLDGANLPMVVLVTVFGAIPALFGYKLGKIADAANKYRLIAWGLFGVALIALGLVVFPQYWFKLAAMILMGVILELFSVVQSSLVTTLGPQETYGVRGSVFEIIVVASDMVAPLIIGIAFDIAGFSHTVAVMAAVAVALAIAYGIGARSRAAKSL